MYILNAAAFPDASAVSYDKVLPYALARLPDEDELLTGTEYEIVFFAGDQPEGATTEKRQGPGIGWYLQAYHVLSRATRKRLQRLFIVHPRTWVRVLLGVFGTIVSPKFRRKIITVTSLTALALHIPVENLLIPPSVYLQDRKLSSEIYVPFATGRRAFGVKHPLPKDITTGAGRLPRVLRETTTFLLDSANVKTEGLFRIPPQATLASVLKEAYDRGQQFVIWKDNGVTVTQPDMDLSIVEEVRLEDSYGVHLAASLIKQWYRDLQEPIFPESSYAALRDRYGDPEKKVTPEDLVELILPQSPASLLSQTARQILIRHLLPLLNEVAAHEIDNKMNADNLSILFSMCLVCGTDQMEDARIAQVSRRILHAAIDMWPQLRDGMDISSGAFESDLQVPADPRDYEDPLEEERPPRQQHLSEDDIVEGREGHRIMLADTEDLRTLEDANVLERVPTLPPRPRSKTIPSSIVPDYLASDANGTVPKRKPAPPLGHPPRYSSLFDVETSVLGSAQFLNNYVHPSGAERSSYGIDESAKKGFSDFATVPATNINGVAAVPKRRPVSTEATVSGTPEPISPAPERPSDRDLLPSRLPDRATPNNSYSTMAGDQPNDNTPEILIPTADTAFAKSLWPASAPPQDFPPALPGPRHSQTFPLAATDSAQGGPQLSSGLLQRMNSMELAGINESSRSGQTQPR